MDERDRIIREDYPVERLPEDLRAGLSDGERVRVTIEALEIAETAAGRKKEAWERIDAMIEKLHAHPDFRPVTRDAAAARVRALRDEWPD